VVKKQEVKESEVSSHKPEARSPEPEARSPKPEARSPKPKAQSPEPEARSPKPEAQSPEPEAQSPEPEARSPKPDPEDELIAEHLSIKKASMMLNGDNKKKDDEEVAEQPKSKNAFTQEHLNTVWEQVIPTICKHSANLKSSLAGKKPLLKEGFHVEITLDNKVIEREIRELLPAIHAQLREKLKNDYILVNTKLADIKMQQDKAYFPDEIYKKMVEKNPEIKNLRDQLDLEIDF